SPAPAPAGQPGAPRVPPKLEAVTPFAHVEAVGNGPVALSLVSDWGLDWTMWQPFMDRHKSDYTMFAVTLPGFGGSEPPPLPVGAQAGDALWLHNGARAILDLVRDRKLEKPVVIGQFLGGYVALLAALRSPDTFRSVVTIDAPPALPLGPMGSASLPPEFRRNAVETQFRRNLEQVPEEALLEQHRKVVTSWTTDERKASKFGDMVVRVPRTVRVTYLSEVMAVDISAEMTSLTTPVLFVAPTPPEETPPVVTRAGVRSFWRGFVKDAARQRLVFFEGSRRLLIDDDADFFDNMLKDYLENKPLNDKPPATSVPGRAPATSGK
ncbi:MAG TPA: alpha/beta fold hydrolase, partial [Phycisphaerales bacterium]|nr:alpha/beta fold hydrolase [Phycisphaerales bacterium]